jgi:hypothetical protein
MIKNNTILKILEGTDDNSGSPSDKIEELKKVVNKSTAHLKYLKKVARYIGEALLVTYLVFQWVSTLFL